jgi:3-deoxy-manno-octulosonate cytidylyltransferase (CMP-KDO synthetase)
MEVEYIMKVIACIPARYSSTRFPGKVLAKETGKYLIQHTYEKACMANLPEMVLIAADDQKVFDAVISFGAQCVMTSPKHQSGTDRIAEAVKDIDAEIIVNVQGDEPEIDPANIDYLAQLLIDNPDAQMATLVTPITTLEQVTDPNVVKVVLDNTGRAIYFSRSPIPYDRENPVKPKTDHYLRHIGIYAYRMDFLQKYTTLKQTPLEKTEKLEQLRVIENGFAIMVGIVKQVADGIDTPEQYAEFVKRQKTLSQK